MLRWDISDVHQGVQPPNTSRSAHKKGEFELLYFNVDRIAFQISTKIAVVNIPSTIKLPCVDVGVQCQPLLQDHGDQCEIQ